MDKISWTFNIPLFHTLYVVLFQRIKCTVLPRKEVKKTLGKKTKMLHDKEKKKY